MKLTENQRRVIDILGMNATTPNGLFSELGTAPSAGRSLVQRLKDRGLVRQLGRGGILFLSDAGRALLKTARDQS